MPARKIIRVSNDSPAALRAACLIVLAGSAAACVQESPRSFVDFRDDAIARDGVLARCERDANVNDLECEAARRAAAAEAAGRERGREAERAAESARKLAALREREAFETEVELQAAAEAEAAAAAAYDAQWVERDETAAN